MTTSAPAKPRLRLPVPEGVAAEDVLLQFMDRIGWDARDAVRIVLAVHAQEVLDVHLTQRYAKVAAVLRRDIAIGIYRSDLPFPSLTAISERFGVSRPIAAKAISLLIEEGLVARVKTGRHRAFVTARTPRD